MDKIDRTGPILIGGLVGGVLTGIPIVNCLNCFCCSLYILGGGIAGMMYARNAATMNVFPTAGQGALTGGLAGGLAGVIGALIGGVINFALSAVGMLDNDPSEIVEQLPPDLDPEVAEWIIWGAETFGGPPNVGTVMIGVGFGLFLGFLFGMIGGAIGCAMSRKPPVATPAPAAPPPFSPPSVPPSAGGPPPQDPIA